MPPPPDEGSSAGRRRALVTGASRGIGRALADALAARGMEVVGTSRSSSERADPPNEHERGGSLRFAVLDIADPSSIESFVRDGFVPDILINNAGQSQIGPAEEASPESLRALFEVNFFGTVDLIRRLLPTMREQAGGKREPAWILNVGSLAATFPVPFQSAYVASKCALAGYTACLRSELKPWNIEVALLEPSDIRTTIEPERIAPPQSAYESALEAMSASRDRSMHEAGPPEQVVRTGLRLLDSSRATRPVYPVGGNAPFFCFLKRLLPAAFVEKLVRKRYGLE